MAKRTKRWSIASYVLLGLFFMLLGPFAPPYALTLFTSIIIFAIFVSSANLLTGYTGLISLGQAMFWGSGAYMVAVLTGERIVTNFYEVVLISLFSVIVISLFFGVLAVRVKRLYFMILTFAFGQVLWSIVMYPIQHITHGFDGIKGIARPDLGLPWSMQDNVNFYYFVLVVATLCFFLVYLIIRSPFGHALVGIRDNEHRMVALGYNTFLHKYICYIISAIIGGVGGILFAYFNGYVSPSELHWLWSGEALMMVFIGGIGTFWGPLLGALVYTGLRYWISAYTMYWFGIEGAIFILVVLYFRGGIVGFLVDLQRRFSRGSA